MGFILKISGSIVSWNPISDQIHQLRDFVSMEGVRNFRIIESKIYYNDKKCDENDTDLVCIYAENLHPVEEEKPYKYKYSSSLLDVIFLKDPLLKPRIAAVKTISLLVSDKIGRITWNAGRNPPFQAQNRLWRNTTFLLKVTSPEGGDEASPIEIYTDVNDVRIDLKPGIKYRAQVQTCSNDFCSSPITTSNTALEDLEKQIPFVFIKKKQDDIEAIDIIGDVIEVDESVHNLAKFTYPYVLDNTTRTVYMAGDHSMGIYKKELGDTQGPPKPFKDGLFVEMLSIMPSRAIIVIASSYRIVSYRLPTTFDYELYTCEEPLEACAEVMGISSDDTSGEIYFLTQSRNGSVSLYKSKDYATSFVSSTLTLPPLRRFLMVGDKMILVTKTGHIVQTDKSLSVINVAFQLVRVEKIIPIRYDSNFHKIEFTDDIKFSDDSKKNLLWSISPPTDFGGVLYKVMLFRDKMGLEAPIVNVQVDSNYTIPAEILDQWSSAQRFDISVQAITPWTSTMLNRTGLLAPIKPPTPPTQLRIYATQQKTVDGPRALISFFWSAPLEWNGTPYQYIVNCTKEDGTWIGGPVTTSQSHYSFAVKSGKVSCCAAAANEPVNVGSFSDTISIDSSELKPLVKLFAIDSTSSLIAINDLAGKEEVRSSKKKRQIAQPTRLEYYALAFIGEDLYAVRKEGDSAQPVLVQIDTNHIENTLHKVSIGGDVTRIDAMTSDWVGHRLLFAAGTILYQLPLEPFQSTSLLNPSKVIQLTAATDAKQLTYDPFKNTAYLLTKNGSLFALDLNKGTEENLALSISCLSSQTITWMMAEFTWNRASSPKIYALTWNGLISVDVAEENQCNEVRIDWTKFGEKGLKAISSFAIADKLFAFVTSSEMLIYGKDVVTPIPIANPPLKQILAVSQSSQPYPDRSCFELPSSKGIAFNIINEGKTGAYLEVNRSTSAPNACQDISMPLTQYEIYFTRKNTDKVKHVRSFTDRIHVENGILDKETDYDVTVSWLNRYSPGSGVSVVKSFRTGFGYPSAPRDPHAIPVTPDTVYLYWNLPETLNAPISEIKYQISQQAAGLASPISIAVTPLSDGVASNTSSDSAACLINPCRVKIANLRASNEYKFWITATHISHIDNSLFNDEEAVSTEATARTLDIPGTLRPDNVTGSSLLLRWNGLEPETFPTSVSVQFKESGEINDWQTPDTNATFEPSVTSEIVLIRNLLSATSYDYRFVATYTGTYTVDGKVLAYKEDYYQIAQQARTKAGVPTQPQAVEARFDADGWILTWKEPMSDGGSPITSYAVETRVNKTAEWEIAERGLDGWKSWWRPGKTDNTPSDLEFRIRAANIEGFGPYAYIEQQEKESEEAESNMTLLIVILLLIVVALAIILLVFMWLKTYREQQIKKREAQDEQNCIRLDVVTNLTFSPIHPLPPEINNEIKNLPHINKKVVTISSFLSEGSYGSIHKGIASEVPLSWEKNIKVAVKSLKEDYSYHDKVIFMKEAILLNNIDHPNIVKLHGVCLTQGSEFIILELMQGGVLLSFLRDSVPTENQPSELCLRDLLSFAVDIARGMNYLERLPHVQRDLSARKCLLSERIGPNRVTKLEVSISKNLVNPNMTKAELEGNDQVRWMAPETLKELTFTSKTDVWSFGVLLYEIFSLGEEPFIEKNNKKVITDVREGIILPKPMYCLDRLYKLMQQCWAYEPSKRPNFATILKIFESFRERVEFQDDKPFQYHDNHFNGAFDISHDSTSSERIESRPPPSPSNLNKSFGGFDNQAYEHMDKIEISAKKNGVAARSLRKEKTKFRNVQGSADDTDQRIFRPLSIHSTDTISTDYGASSSLNSPSRSNPLALQAGYIFDNGTKTRLSASPGLGNANDGFVGSQSLNSSKSWNLMSGDVQQNPNGLQSTPQHSNSAGTLRPRLETLPSSRNRQSRHNRVSQV